MHVTRFISEYGVRDSRAVNAGDQTGGESLLVDFERQRQRFDLTERRRAAEIVAAIECAHVLDQSFLQDAAGGRGLVSNLDRACGGDQNVVGSETDPAGCKYEARDLVRARL